MGLFLLNGQVERYGEAMKELVKRKVDVILAFGPEAALKAAIAATNTLPIVMPPRGGISFCADHVAMHKSASVQADIGQLATNAAFGARVAPANSFNQILR
jgi:phosphoribosylcarboxyaminoimidazole (NCAIR) mutase